MPLHLASCNSRSAFLVLLWCNISKTYHARKRHDNHEIWQFDHVISQPPDVLVIDRRPTTGGGWWKVTLEEVNCLDIFTRRAPDWVIISRAGESDVTRRVYRCVFYNPRRAIRLFRWLSKYTIASRRHRVDIAAFIRDRIVSAWVSNGSWEKTLNREIRMQDMGSDVHSVVWNCLSHTEKIS